MVDQISVCPQKPLGVAIILILPWVFYSRLEVRACKQYKLWFTHGHNGIRSSQIITGGHFSSRESAWWVFLSAASFHIFESLEFQEESISNMCLLFFFFLYSFFPARSSLWAVKGAVMQRPYVMLAAQLSSEAVSLIHVFKLCGNTMVLNKACFLYSVKVPSSSTKCLNVR